MESYSSLYCTFADEVEARRIAGLVLEARLAACVNILGAGASLYRWQGKIEESRECFAIMKTRTALVERLSAAIKKHHSYDVPCIVAWPVTGGHAPYLDWIGAETKPR